MIPLVRATEAGIVHAESALRKLRRRIVVCRSAIDCRLGISSLE